MNHVELLTEALATVVYPGLAAVCLLWVHVGVARWWSARRLLDLLLILTATMATATFVMLSPLQLLPPPYFSSAGRPFSRFRGWRRPSSQT